MGPSDSHFNLTNCPFVSVFEIWLHSWYFAGTTSTTCPDSSVGSVNEKTEKVQSAFRHEQVFSLFIEMSKQF
jgi:hypothetical protein